MDRAATNDSVPAPGEGESAPITLLTVRQVAERLNVAPATVYALCASRKLEHVRVGAGRGTLRIEEDALQRYIQRATVRPDEPVAPQPRTPAPTRPAVTLKNLSLS